MEVNKHEVVYLYLSRHLHYHNHIRNLPFLPLHMSQRIECDLCGTYRERDSLSCPNPRCKDYTGPHDLKCRKCDYIISAASHVTACPQCGDYLEPI